MRVIQRAPNWADPAVPDAHGAVLALSKSVEFTAEDRQWLVRIFQFALYRIHLEPMDVVATYLEPMDDLRNKELLPIVLITVFFLSVLSVCMCALWVCTYMHGWVCAHVNVEAMRLCQVCFPSGSFSTLVLKTGSFTYQLARLTIEIQGSSCLCPQPIVTVIGMWHHYWLMCECWGFKFR